MAAREARRYRKRGPGAASGVLIDALAELGVEGAVVLDVGGGVGAIQHELLARGASRSVSVDVVSSYRDELIAEAERRGHRERVRAVEGDFVELAPSLEPVQIVTLDKVICCDPDVGGLVGAAAGRATRLVGLVYPRDTLLVRSGAALLNAGLRLFRRRFRWFVHPVVQVDAILRGAGFERAFTRRGARLLPWEIAVYER